jgi:tRNA threonylcarbamoyladenosine biosynthesis protein TsaE
LGWDEAREGIVLVEWPERLGPHAPPEALRIHLTPGAAEEARHVVLSGWDARLEALRP